MKNRSGPELLKGYTTIYNLLSERRLAPKIHYLDNECPKVLQQFMAEKDERFQLVPPPYTEETRQNGPSRRSNTTSLQD